MKKHNLFYGCRALSAVLLPQAACRILPALNSAGRFAAGCTGACGSCGGSCAGVFGTLLFLGFCACRNRKAE